MENFSNTNDGLFDGMAGGRASADIILSAIGNDRQKAEKMIEELCSRADEPGRDGGDFYGDVITAIQTKFPVR